MSNRIKEFKLYNDVVNFDTYIRQYISSDIPNVHKDLKIHLFDESYNTIRSLVLAIDSKGNIREKSIRDTLVSITMINVLIDEIKKFCPNISNKHLDKTLGMLANIKNMTQAWLNTEEKRKNEK